MHDPLFTVDWEPDDHIDYREAIHARTIRFRAPERDDHDLTPAVNQ